jgi:hypothetical protein
MKIKVSPVNSPESMSLHYTVPVEFDGTKTILFVVVVSYQPDPKNPLNALRFAITAENLEPVPFGTKLDQLLELLEQQAGIWTPQSLQFWPQYVEQPVEIRKMPQFALILQKIKIDAVASFMAFMKDKHEFHVFSQGTEIEKQTDESDWMLNLPEIETPSGRCWLQRVFWADHNKTIVMFDVISMVTYDQSSYAAEALDLEALCGAADLIQYWHTVIKKMN